MSKKLQAKETRDALLESLERINASPNTVRFVSNLVKSGGDIKAAFGAEVIGPVGIGVCWQTTDPSNTLHRKVHRFLTALGFKVLMSGGADDRYRHYVLVRSSHSVDLGAQVWRRVNYWLKRNVVDFKEAQKKGHPKLLGLSSWDFGSNTYPAKYFPRLGFPGSEINDEGKLAKDLSLPGMFELGMIPNVALPPEEAE